MSVEVNAYSRAFYMCTYIYTHKINAHEIDRTYTYMYIIVCAWLNICVLHYHYYYCSDINKERQFNAFLHVSESLNRQAQNHMSDLTPIYSEHTLT